ncbi:MAG: flagellar basal body L-ring protein FlgH [Cellvibrionales bacterium]|jgi:flagellar L-ring protein precursor FlgH
MTRTLLTLLTLGLGLIGCGGVEQKVHPAYAPIEPIEYPEQAEGATPASLYNEQRGMSLFADTRARSIGDIVSVVLTESTSAAKSADTDLSKGSEIGVEVPTLYGQPFDFGGGDEYNLSQSLSSEYGFQGQGSSNQSNRLQGAIAVQVAKVLPNGNLVVQGEKWIKLNQGDEFIQLRGIIRPEDITPLNTISSTLVADARISYGGTGAIEDANTPGWMTRFFTSPLNPF